MVTLDELLRDNTGIRLQKYCLEMGLEYEKIIENLRRLEHARVNTAKDCD